MADVDPRLQQIPKELQDTFNKRVYFEELERFLHDLWVRTGGGDDEIAAQSTQELYSWRQGRVEQESTARLFGSKTSKTSKDLISLYSRKGAVKEFEVVEVTGTTHTTTGNEIVICSNTSPLIVTLNPTPDHMERAIIVRNSAGAVSVTSDKKISGKTTKKILRRYSAPDHIFTTEADTWNVI